MKSLKQFKEIYGKENFYYDRSANVKKFLKLLEKDSVKLIGFNDYGDGKNIKRYRRFLGEAGSAFSFGYTHTIIIDYNERKIIYENNDSVCFEVVGEDKDFDVAVNAISDKIQK